MEWVVTGSTTACTRSAVSTPSVTTGMSAQPAMLANPPASPIATCEAGSQMTARPRSESVSRLTIFPIVPLVTSSAASFPKSSAARSSSSLTVGSSWLISSPTAQRAIASRISGVGTVRVSLRSSMR